MGRFWGRKKEDACKVFRVRLVFGSASVGLLDFGREKNQVNVTVIRELGNLAQLLTSRPNVLELSLRTFGV